MGNIPIKTKKMGGGSRTLSKKHKIILIGAIASLGVIILGVGLGVGLSGESKTSEDSNSPQIDIKVPNEKITKRANYQLIEKGEGEDRKVIIRLNEKTTFDQIKKEVSQIKEDLENKTITELRLPYGTRNEFQTTDSKLDIAKIKNELGIEIEESRVGYVFYPSDETDENRTYKNQNLFEVVLPKTQKTIVRVKFQNNRIRKVNFEELRELETIGRQSFQGNQFSEKVIIPSKVTFIALQAFGGSQLKELDLSNAKSLLTIDNWAFRNNQISGIVVIPLNITRIGDQTFKNNKIEYLDLSKAVKLESIGEEAFDTNNLEDLDFSKNVSLKGITSRSFQYNNIESLNLNAPLLDIIQQDAFKNNKNKDTQKTTDPLPDGFIFNKKMNEIWSGAFSRPYTIGETKKVVFIPKQMDNLENGAFSRGYAVYKAEVDLSILEYKVGVDSNNQYTLTFDDDATIGDVILRQDLIRKLNSIRKIDKYVFPYSSITKFGDGEEFSKTSKRLLNLKKYLGLSDAVDAWIAGTTNP